MVLVSKASGSREVSEILKLMLHLRSLKPSDSEFSQKSQRGTNIIAEATSRVDGYFKKLRSDVEETWFSKDSSPRHVASELAIEAAELVGEFVKEERTGMDRTVKIASELVDVLYFTVKLTESAKVENPSLAHIITLNDEPAFEISIYAPYSAESLGESIGKNARLILDCVRRSTPGTPNAGLGSLDTLLMLVLLLAEKRDIDIETAWDEKMEFNKVRVR